MDLFCATPVPALCRVRLLPSHHARYNPDRIVAIYHRLTSSALLSKVLCAIRVSRAQSLVAVAVALARSGTSRGHPSGNQLAALRAMSASANGASASTSLDDKSTKAAKQPTAKEVARAASKKKDVFVDPEVVQRRREEKAAEKKRKAEAEEAERVRIVAEGGSLLDSEPEAASAGFIKREFVTLPLLGTEAEASGSRQPRKLKLMSWNVSAAYASLNALRAF